MTVAVHMEPATKWHAAHLALSMRDIEKDEVYALTGEPILRVIQASIDVSEHCFAIIIENQLMGIWGVVPWDNGVLGGRCGSPWLLTTYTVERYPKTFWKMCLAVIPRLAERWDVLTNVIDERHEKAVRWAMRLGFELEESAPTGIFGLPFRRFTLTRGQYNGRTGTTTTPKH